MVLCECGKCGRETRIYRGKSRRFIDGHNSKGIIGYGKGDILSEEWKAKVLAGRIRKANGTQKIKIKKGHYFTGKKKPFLPEGVRIKISNSLRGHKLSKERIEKIRITKIGRPSGMKGKHHSEETKRKMREAKIKRQLTFGNIRIGKYETQILDKLDELYKIKCDRKFMIAGY